MGNRKTREQRSKRRVPEMGYYLVVTDTEATERCFFDGLHDSLANGYAEKTCNQGCGNEDTESDSKVP